MPLPFERPATSKTTVTPEEKHDIMTTRKSVKDLVAKIQNTPPSEGKISMKSKPSFSFREKMSEKESTSNMGKPSMSKKSDKAS